MSKQLTKKFHFMSPVEAVKITPSNLEVAAKWCGGLVKETESRRRPGTMDRYIDVPIPKSGKGALSWAFPGMIVTKRLVVTVENDLKVTYAVFRNDFFSKNYFSEPIHAVDAHWQRLENEQMKPEVVTSTGQTAVVMNIHVATPGEVGKALEKARENLMAKEREGTMVVNLIEADQPLSPREQRELITESLAEAEVVDAAEHTKLPEDATHPSLKAAVASQEIVDAADSIKDPGRP